MTLNALGTKMKDSDKTLAEELGIELPKAKELTAEVKDTENLAEVVVELSNVDLVKNKEALTNPANYRLNDSNVKVYNVDVDGDDVILTLVPYGRVDEAQKEFDANKNVLVKGKKYDLTIRNIDPVVDAEKQFSTSTELVSLINKLDNVTAAVDNTDVKVTAKVAGKAGNDIVLNAGKLTGGKDRVPFELALTFENAKVKDGKATVTRFGENVKVADIITTNTLTSITGLETVNGKAVIVDTPVTITVAP